MMADYGRHYGYAILRLTLGAVFLFFGIGKFVAGIAATAQGMEQSFAKTWVPAAMVSGFSTVLPFLEVGLGVLLILGWRTRIAATIAGLLTIQLTVGLVILGSASGVAQNMLYTLGLVALLYLEDDNRFSVDGWLHRLR